MVPGCAPDGAPVPPNIEQAFASVGAAAPFFDFANSFPPRFRERPNLSTRKAAASRPNRGTTAP